jgi:hypothetical protein
MKFGHYRFAAAALAVALLAMSSDQGARPVPRPGIPSAAAAEDMIGRWPEQSRALARLMLEKYGSPDELVASQLSWSRRPPWNRIVVFRDPDRGGGSNHLLQSVVYGDVLLGRWRDIAAFGRGAAYDPGTRELTARTDAEATNFLSLNLADEVLRGRRSAADARDFYDAASNLALYGKSSPYMTGLLFRPRDPALRKVEGP